MDWLAIKTEYITTDTSYRKLAAKYGVTYNVIGERARKEKWGELRDQYRDETVSKSVEKISKKRSDKMARIDDLADKLILKLERAIGELDMQIVTKKVKVETGNTEETTEYKEAMKGGVVDRAGLRQLTAALKDLKEVKGVMSELDRREQEARIANLQRQAARGEDNGASEITVRLEGLEDYAK